MLRNIKIEKIYKKKPIEVSKKKRTELLVMITRTTYLKNKYALNGFREATPSWCMKPI